MDKFLPKFDVEKTKKIDNLLSNEINSFAGFAKLSTEEKIDREKALISNIDDFIFDASRHQIPAKAISYGKKLLNEGKEVFKFGLVTYSNKSKKKNFKISQ